MQKELLEKLLRRQILSQLGWFQKRPHPPSPLNPIKPDLFAGLGNFKKKRVFSNPIIYSVKDYLVRIYLFNPFYRIKCGKGYIFVLKNPVGIYNFHHD